MPAERRAAASTPFAISSSRIDAACDTIEKAQATECPGSSAVNRKYKGPDGLMIDLRAKGWDEQIKAKMQLYQLTPVSPD